MTYKFAFYMTTAALLMCAGCADFNSGGGGSVDPDDGVNAYLSMFNPVLSTYVSPGNGGRVLVFTPPNSYGTYKYGDTVTVTAMSSSSFIFKEWSGALTATSDTVRIVMDGNKTLTANFEPKE